MYNKQQKQDFVSDIYPEEPSTSRVMSLFDAIEEDEKRFGCDFCQMTRDQAQETFERVAGLKANSLATVYACLKKYIDWCMLHGFRQEEAFRLSFAGLDSIRNSMVSSLAHLSRVIDLVYDKAPRLNSEYIYRATLWLCFAGVDVREIALLNEDNIHDLTVTQDDENAPVRLLPAEALTDVRMAQTLRTIGKTYYTAVVEQPRVEGTHLARMLREVDPHILRSALVERLRQTRVKLTSAGGVPDWLPLKLSYSNIFLSGLFCRAYDREKMGDVIDFYEESRDIMRCHQRFGWEYADSKSNMRVTMLRLRTDYARWKLAFT